MTRSIVALPDLSGTPLDQCRQWLAISTARDDALLLQLLHAACALCEGFTRLVPLATQFEERLPAVPGWQALATRPVSEILAVEQVAAGGTRTLLSAGYETRIDGERRGHIRLLQPDREAHCAVRFAAGLEADWTALPPGLAQGVIRLAAHHYRTRDSGENASPPAAIAALWRPFRVLQL
jgi:uncharacterized phiE125 gp8 family phage protein